MAKRVAKKLARRPKASRTKAKPATRRAAKKPAAAKRTAKKPAAAKRAGVKIVKAKPARVGSTEEREAAALAVAEALEQPPADAATTRGLADHDLERLASAPLDTLTTRRLTGDDVRPDQPANENTPAPSLSSAPLATIAPRGVFLPDRVVVDIEGDTFPSTKLDEHGRDEAVLPATTIGEIKERAAEAQRLVDTDPAAAFSAFHDALDLLPQPHQNWNAAAWLLVAMGECAIRSGDHAAAIVPLKDAMHCPGAIGNPWVHLRLGQCRLELGDERAADDLARAYMGGGRTLFEGLDAKYFAVVESVLQPPPGHDRLP